MRAGVVDVGGGWVGSVDGRRRDGEGLLEVSRLVVELREGKMRVLTGRGEMRGGSVGKSRLGGREGGCVLRRRSRSRRMEVVVVLLRVRRKRMGWWDGLAEGSWERDDGSGTSDGRGRCDASFRGALRCLPS